MSFHVEFWILYGNVSKVFTILSVADEIGEYIASQGMTAEILEYLLDEGKATRIFRGFGTREK